LHGVQRDANSLDVRRVGSGPPVVLVPGSIVGAERLHRFLTGRPPQGAAPSAAPARPA
jgi:hypothetical protein